MQLNGSDCYTKGSIQLLLLVAACAACLSTLYLTRLDYHPWLLQEALAVDEGTGEGSGDDEGGLSGSAADDLDEYITQVGRGASIPGQGEAHLLWCQHSQGM
jgi:hypothetical protein